MTNTDLRLQYDHKRRILQNLRDEEIISQETYDATLERIKNETFFCVDVLADINTLPTVARAA